MKILHTSDWHLGAMDKEKSLHEDQLFFINRICEIVEENRINAVLIAGDVFDRSVAAAEAVNLYDYAMTRLCRDLHTTVVLIAGNHDSAERLSSCGELLSAAGLHICGAIEREPAVIHFDDTDIYLLPWITEEKVKSIFPMEKDNINSLEDAYNTVTASMRCTFDQEKRHVILAHAYIANSETSVSDRAAEIGFAAQVPSSVFTGFDYVALGHIHKPQNVNGKIRYSGTPMPYAFGKEENQEKSVTLIDTETMEQTIISLPLLHRRTTLTGTLMELLSPDCPDEVRNGYVRIKVTDNYVGLETLSKLRNIYPNLIEVTGKSFEGEDTTISLTMDDFEKMEEDPVEVFRSFCREVGDGEPDAHLTELFENAMKAVEEKEQ